MINTKTGGYVSAQVTESKTGVLISFCQYPASGSTVLSIEEAVKLADSIYELAGANQFENYQAAA